MEEIFSFSQKYMVGDVGFENHSTLEMDEAKAKKLLAGVKELAPALVEAFQECMKKVQDLAEAVKGVAEINVNINPVTKPEVTVDGEKYGPLPVMNM